MYSFNCIIFIGYVNGMNMLTLKSKFTLGQYSIFIYHLEFQSFLLNVAKRRH